MEIPQTWSIVEGSYFAEGSLVTRTFSLCQGDVERSPTPTEICDVLNNKDLAYWENELLLKAGIVVDRTKEEIPKEDLAAIPSGVYGQVFDCKLGEGLNPMELRSEITIQIGNTQALLEKEIQMFLDNEEAYDKVGITYKRGFLLYGPPGNGKSCILRAILQQLAKEKNALVLFTREVLQPGTIKRLNEDPRLKVVVFEELTELFSNKTNSTMQQVLSFLDGEHSMANTIVFATTNYAGQLPANLIRRPGRFDRLLKFDDPDAATRSSLLEHYGETSSIEKIEATKGLSIAAIQEIVRRSQLHGTSLLVTIEDFNRQCETAERDFGESSKEIETGFQGTAEESPV